MHFGGCPRRPPLLGSAASAQPGLGGCDRHGRRGVLGAISLLPSLPRETLGRGGRGSLRALERPVSTPLVHIRKCPTSQDSQVGNHISGGSPPQEGDWS